MADALNRVKGHAREQTLATRTVSEENKRLRSDLEQRRMEKEVGATPAQPAHIEPPPCPIAARPARAPGTSRAHARSGAPNQACRIACNLRPRLAK
eukprot:5121948-Pyramimonas_sp.AAC.1